MKEYKTGQIRNIALISHNGAGKTSLVERLLFQTEATTRMGSVGNGTAVMDFEEEEIERNSSISTAIAPVEWNGVKVNLLDTPGYADFVGEVLSALKVVEAAVILVEAVAGVEVGTELVWQYAEEQDLPRFLVVNKVDRENVRIQRVMESINTNLDGTFVNLQLPIGEGTDFKGVVDLINMEARLGDDGKKGPIPDDMASAVETARFELIEAAAEGDDELLMQYLEGEELSKEEIIQGLKGAMAQGTAVPILYVAGEPGIGTAPFMDVITQLAPPPDVKELPAQGPAGDEIVLQADDSGPLAAFIFKTREDPYGKMSYLRVFSGMLTSDSRIWDVNQDTEVRVGTLNVLRGKEQLSVSTLHSGDIGAVVKLGDAQTNDTLADKGHQITIEATPYPEPIASVAVQPVAQSDVAKLSQSLTRLVDEDPTLRWFNEQSTRETILSGMGTTHLNMAIKKAQSKFGVNLTQKIPKVPYRETITRTNSADYTHKKQSGGAGQYARVFLRVESLDDDAEFEFESEIFGGSISAPFVAATEKGCRKALEKGALAGYQMTGIKAIVYDGKEHPVDSKEIAFQTAGRECFKKAVMGAGPVLLEPIYNLTVTVPADNMGDIMGDMNSRRARVLGMDQEGTKSIVHAEVPLAEMQTYLADLRSMTQGRGHFKMEFLRYGRVPNHLQQSIIDKHKEELENES